MSLYALFALTGAVSSIHAAPSLQPRAGEVLYELNNAGATVYYDIAETPDHDLCGRVAGNEGAPFEAMWAVNTGMVNPLTKCATNTGASAMGLKDMGTSRVVAMDASLMNQDLMAWCGKEVKIFQDGVEFTIEDGPFILWDTCDACITDPHVDLSAFVGLSPGGLCRNNIAGLKIQVVNNQIWSPPLDPSWRPGGDVQPGPIPKNSMLGGLYVPNNQGTNQSTPVPPNQPSAVSVPPGLPPAAGPGQAGTNGIEKPADKCSAKGLNQCDGLQLQICNAVGSPYPYLDWVSIGTCATYCDIARTPMCG